ncbi:MAG: tetratricopeptide repeat protein, partial [Bacteroidota bacterium]
MLTSGLSLIGQAEADRLYQATVQQYYATDYDSALALGREAERLIKAGNDPYRKVLIEMILGKIMLMTGDYQESDARFVAGKVLADSILSDGDSIRLWFMDRLGEHQANLGRVEEGLQTHQRNLSAKKQLASLPDTSLANSYFFLAQDFSRLGQYDSALYSGEKSLAIREEALEPTERALGILYNLLGIVATETYDLPRSNHYYELALENFLTREDSSNLHVLQIFNNIGTNKVFLHQFQEGIELLRLPLQYLDELPLENQLSFLYNLGLGYNSLGDYEQAIFYLQQASGLNMPGTPFFAYIQMWVDYELARTYFRRQETDKALGLIQSVRRRLESPDAISDSDEGLIYFLEGDILYDLKRYEEALAMQAKAKEAFLKYYDEDYYLLGEVYYEQGQYHEAKKDYPAAAEAYDRALGLYRTNFADYYDEIGITLTRKARMLQEAGEGNLAFFEEAVKGYFPKLPTYDPLDQEYVLANWCCFYLDEVLTETGEAYHEEFEKKGDLKDLQQAWRFLETAVQLTDSFRYQFQDQASRRDWTRQYLPLYESAIKTGIRLYEQTNEIQYLQAILNISEKNKAWTLREAIFDQQAIQFGRIPEAVQARESELRQELAYLKQQIEDLEDSSQLVRFQHQQRETQQAYQTLITELERDYPNYYALKYTDPQFDLAQLQSQLDGRLMYHYFIGEESWNIFRIDSQAVKTYQLPKEMSDSLGKALGVWREFLSRPPAGDQEIPITAGRLLFEQLLPDIGEASQLLIIPDGELGYLPFGTLLSEEVERADYRALPYLIRQASVAYHSSTALWLDAQDRRASRAAMAYLGIAPSFGEGDGFAERSDEPAPLQYNREEVALVVK